MKLKYIVAGYVLLALAVSLSYAPRSEEVSEYCYDPYGQDVEAEHAVNYVYLRVIWNDNGRGGDAWSEWEIWEDENGEIFSECTVSVPPPQQILGDPDMDALGHEVLHCIIGNFHDEESPEATTLIIQGEDNGT